MPLHDSLNIYPKRYCIHCGKCMYNKRIVTCFDYEHGEENYILKYKCPNRKWYSLWLHPIVKADKFGDDMEEPVEW